MRQQSLWRLGMLPKKKDEKAGEEDDEVEEGAEVGPAAVLSQMPRQRQFAIIATLATFAGVTTLVEAEPFAESLIGAATVLGINKFLLIQRVSPMAGEAPEIVITILFTLSLRPTYALGASFD